MEVVDLTWDRWVVATLSTAEVTGMVRAASYLTGPHSSARFSGASSGWRGIRRDQARAGREGISSGSRRAPANGAHERQDFDGGGSAVLMAQEAVLVTGRMVRDIRSVYRVGVARAWRETQRGPNRESQLKETSA